MRTGPGSGPAPARPSRATPARVPNAPDSPRTVVQRRATPEAWAAYLAETAPVEIVVPEPAARPSRVGAVVTGGAVVTAVALTLVALTLAPRTSAASAPWERPVARPVARAVAPEPAPQPFPGRVAPSVRQVVSVVAASSVSRTAVLQRWQRDAAGTWQAVGAPARVELGAGGLTRSPSDQRPQTPIGTWAMDAVLTRDAGVSRLPEHVLRPGDGWSSCLSCANYDRLARSGELWAGRNTWSRIAIHIVTNPRHLRGRSSGIFLHVGAGGPTAGCIGTSLPVALSVAGWLDPAARPRIVVAVRG